MHEAPDLPRRPPATIPPIRTVPEHAATGELKRRYEAMKAGFGVPWMGVVAMAHAAYPRFYGVLWDALGPICRTRDFRNGCAAMRAATEAAAAALAPPPIAERLRDLGYGPREREEIFGVIEAFSQGNYPYLLLATLSRHWLGGGSLAVREAEPAPPLAVPARALVLMEPHHADRTTRALYDDIRATLALPVLNTDYRALARWPSYFALAWADLKPIVRTPPHAAMSQRLHDDAVAIARALPNPTGITGAAMRAAADEDASAAEVLAMAELFQWLLPELAVNVAFFRAQLA